MARPRALTGECALGWQMQLALPAKVASPNLPHLVNERQPCCKRQNIIALIAQMLQYALA